MTDTTNTGKTATEIFGSDRMWGLKEVPLPEPISWWPQTPAWYVLGLLFIAFAIWLGLKLRRNYLRNQYRRVGLQHLTRMKSDDSDLSNLPGLLRFSALHAAPRNKVADLHNADWISWLNESAGKELFLPEDSETMEMLVYGNPEHIKIEPDRINRLIDASEMWMRLHRATI